ncbi:MAG TPA: UDP-N-acetylglucosamine 2-epimerase [Phnomibacter sp.]|nr:UDP-N-acetylglucosamine 2-epimerase [Phnomibacter sp.]
MSKRKICVVITARPSYSRIKSALTAIAEHPDLELQLVVAGSALLNRYGSAVEYIEQDGFEIAAKVFMVLEGESPTAMAKTTGLAVMELSTALDNLKPDAVICIADRFETLAVSIAAAYQNIPLVHIQGGEVSGNIDEKVRHANTKMADLHFVASEEAFQRVLQLGEAPDSVFNTGCPSVDLAATMLKDPTIDFDIYKKYGGVGDTPDYSNGYIVVMQHPVTNEYHASRSHIEETLNAINKINIPTFWFWPNVDAGADGTSSGIRSFREMHQLHHVHFFKNMHPTDFLKLLYNAKCLVGNSSVGIRECAYMGVPVLNIGTRQHRRERGPNVMDVGYNRTEIEAAIYRLIQGPRPGASTIYGDGEAGKTIAHLLATVPLQYHKSITY